MKNKKAFTLIELLTVVIILGILLAIALPAIHSYLTRGTKEYYHSLEETVKESGKDYLNDYRTLLPREIGNVTVIELKELTSNNYIKNVVDSNNKACDARVTAKKTGKNEYEYYSCLDCGSSYQTKGEACSFSEDNNITTDTKNYEIKVDNNNSNYEIDTNGVYIVDQGKDFTLPLGKAYYKGQLVNDKVEPKPKTIDTNKLGTTKVTYVYQGATASIIVKVVDRVAPSIPQVVLRKNNSTGNIYTGGWYSGDIYQEYLSTDYSKPGIMGSGVKEYQISTDNSTFTALSRNNQTTTVNGSHTYYVKSMDKSEYENISNSNAYSFKIDKEVPTCSLKVTSGTLGTNGWYISNATVGFGNITEKVSSIVYQNINIPSVTSNGKTTVIGTVMDQAGNIGTCSIDVYVDKVVPVITNSVASGKFNVTKLATITAKDDHSKISLIQYEVYFNGTLQSSNYALRSTSFNVNINKTGTWDIYVKAIDNAGNWSNSGEWTHYTYNIQLCAYNPGHSWEFNYTGGVQDFKIPCNGTYKLEVWGAQGGDVLNSDFGVEMAGSYGGYSQGNKSLSKDSQLYVAVGGKPNFTCKVYEEDDGDEYCAESYGGYNGGGNSTDKFFLGNRFADTGRGYVGSGGGGATHVAITNRGVLSNYSLYRNEVLIVAGGGGGSDFDFRWAFSGGGSSSCKGGTGGGAVSGKAIVTDYTNCHDYDYDAMECGDTETSYKNYEGVILNNAQLGVEATQSSGYSFGQGDKFSGGGWYGGTKFSEDSCGTGGSGYIDGVSDGSMQNGVRSGNGYARVTLISIQQ